MNLIDIKNLTFTYPDTKNNIVLKDLNLSIESNERVGLIGPNGVGKSTLLKILVGLLGEFENITVSNLNLKKKNFKDIRKQVGYIFQDSDSQLFMPTVYSDVSFAAKNYGYSSVDVKKRSEQALNQVGLLEKSDRLIYQLSGGEKKLVAIAGILTLEPKILLMDEPSSALDPKNRKNLIRILNELNCSLFIASHDLDFIYDTCDRVVLLHDGKIKKEGSVEQILKDEELLKACDLELPLRFQK